jgi:hypothetical protein
MEWINVKDRLPTARDGYGDADRNVLVWCDGQLMVMAYCEMRDDDGHEVDVWCNCYGEIDGDPEWDDNYEPTHWMDLPTEPKN